MPDDLQQLNSREHNSRIRGADGGGAVAHLPQILRRTRDTLQLSLTPMCPFQLERLLDSIRGDSSSSQSRTFRLRSCSLPDSRSRLARRQECHVLLRDYRSACGVPSRLQRVAGGQSATRRNPLRRSGDRRHLASRPTGPPSGRSASLRGREFASMSSCGLSNFKANEKRWWRRFDRSAASARLRS